MTKRLLLILFICHLSLLTASAQQYVKGVITDADTGEPLPYASAVYKGHNVAVISDLEGQFSIARHAG